MLKNLAGEWSPTGTNISIMAVNNTMCPRFGQSLVDVLNDTVGSSVNSLTHTVTCPRMELGMSSVVHPNMNRKTKNTAEKKSDDIPCRFFQWYSRQFGQFVNTHCGSHKDGNENVKCGMSRKTKNQMILHCYLGKRWGCEVTLTALRNSLKTLGVKANIASNDWPVTQQSSMHKMMSKSLDWKTFMGGLFHVQVVV